MSNMISTASGFQYSVNIAYDLNKEDKIKNFIPTKSSMNLLEDIILSMKPTSMDRARVLIGAYGKGKSHIVLSILAILMKKDLNLFEKMLPKLKENKKLYQEVLNYYENNNKILPIIITGSNTSLSQSFLLSLQRTLNENDMLDIMPDTNYEAAIRTIKRWEKEFPCVYKEFIQKIDIPINKFINNLEDFNVDAYNKFKDIYPELTAGSEFNPFLGFDIVELYESVAKALEVKGYSGVYVIYDEFSKYLEANINDASISDTKMLQDFAEKCNRSGKIQMHLMLISHKEIVNYIDKLPKNKVDGWRGISERFKHIHLNNNFSQTYEIISSVIQKDDKLWNDFLHKHYEDFDLLVNKYNNHILFQSEDNINLIFRNCYPLHPISIFILPRLSEKIAQNERTLFTFLSAKGRFTLFEFLDNYQDNNFKLLTPDKIYDYFEPLLKKEIYSNELHSMYYLTSKILNRLERNSLEAKLIKTISLIYILEEFERLKPTKDELFRIFSIDYSVKEIEKAIENLIENEYVIYLKKSNNFLKLKQTSGVDLNQAINNKVEKNKNKTSIKSILNEINFDKYIYPYRYNDEREMIRYFTFIFIESKEISEDINWNIKRESINADGIIYAIIPENDEDIKRIKNIILKTSVNVEDCIFIVPKKHAEIKSYIRNFDAVNVLKNEAIDDDVLCEEYEIIHDDLKEIIMRYIFSYTRPERNLAEYYYRGKKRKILRKSSLTELMSDICDEIYKLTPIINNEMINNNKPTSIALNSRTKIISALLRNELEPNLGFSGGGQEVSIMRSTLIRTGILQNINGIVSLNFKVDRNLTNMFNVIVDFISSAKGKEGVSFEKLYYKLISKEFNIGMRLGVIPIYLATVMHKYKKNIIIKDKYDNELPINSDTLLKINSQPNEFFLYYLQWDFNKQKYIRNLENVFQDYIILNEKTVNTYDYILSAMKRWYMSLSKYARNVKIMHNGDYIFNENIKFLNKLKHENSAYKFLFKDLLNIFKLADEDYDKLINKIKGVKNFYDNALINLKNDLINRLKQIFIDKQKEELINKMSLTSIIKDWCDNLDSSIYNQLFTNGADKTLEILYEIDNNENEFIEKIARVITGLRIEDWNTDTIDKFITVLLNHKNILEDFNSNVNNASNELNAYKISFIEENGTESVKNFEKVEVSNRGKLLYNMVTRDIESMGQSLDISEKRQIIINILNELC